MKKIMLAIAAAAVLAGCVSERDGYGSYREKRMTIVNAVESLLSDPMFAELYAKALETAKSAGRDRPVLKVLRIENNADGRGDAATRQLQRRLQTALRKTGKFTIVDVERGQDVIDAVAHGADAGETDDVHQFFGEYLSPDFVMSGEFVKEETGELSLNLDMQDVRTKSVFWSEIVTPSDSFVR